MGTMRIPACLCLLLLLGMQQAVLAKAVTKISIHKHLPSKSHASVQTSNDGDAVKLINYLDAQVRCWRGWEGLRALLACSRSCDKV